MDNRGWIMWLGIVAVVAGWDIPAKRYGWQSGSSWFGLRARYITVPVTVYVIGHLFRFIPWWLDPIEIIGRMIPRKKGTRYA